MAVQKENDEKILYGDPSITNGISVFDEEFDKVYAYDGQDLGLTLTDESTMFKVWAPTANDVEVYVYSDDLGTNKKIYKMIRGEKGVWIYTHPKNLDGHYYTYHIEIEGNSKEAADPYARLVGVNGDRGYIGDLSKSNPVGFQPFEKPPFFLPTDGIIYELHVRDFSMHPKSGMKHKGKFLAFTETGTTGPGNSPTGIDYLRSLGITHVQLLPVFDYSTESVDEEKLDTEQYNWGYDPKNYNAVEGSYSTDPYDPLTRVYELKQAIQKMHDIGLRVIMDVVYNHVFDAYRMSFSKIVPGYYFRYLDNHKLANGSHCGNDTASERAMVRKFIVESVIYWAKEFGIDGFRFDLMGLHDVETMNEIRVELDKIDRSIMMIGEGWNLHTPLKGKKANQKNAADMPRIAQFNDGIRDGVRGSAIRFEEKGLVTGNRKYLGNVLSGITGAISYSSQMQGFAQEPNQTVTYMEAHDNHTVWDKLLVTNLEESEEIRTKMHRLASAIMMTSQGIPFIHAGQEFMRTKNGVENSYRSDTSINWLDWERANERESDVDFMRKLIRLRRKHPAFRMKTSEQIRKNLVFEGAPVGVIAYTLRNHANGDEAKHIFVIHNTNKHDAIIPFPLKEDWKVGFGEVEIIKGKVKLRGMETVVFVAE